MLSATRTKVLLAGVSAAALTILAAVPVGVMLHANEPVDPVTTGAAGMPIADFATVVPAPIPVELPVVRPLKVASIAPGWIETPKAVPTATAPAMKVALDLVSSGDKAGAFKLAEALPAVQRRAVQWAAIYYGGGDIPSDSVLAFTADAPEFARGSLFKTRLEQAVTREKPGGDRVIELLGGSMPNTVYARIALAQAYLADGQKERATGIARAIWTENFLDKGTEDTGARPARQPAGPGCALGSRPAPDDARPGHRRGAAGAST